MGLLIKEKDVVVPGEKLAQGMDYLPGAHTYRDNDYVVAQRLGLASIEGRAIKLIPLSGRYLPKVGDIIVAKVYDIIMSGWLLHTNSAYNAMLSIKDISRFVRKGDDLTRYFDVGDYIRCKIVKVSSQNLVDLTMKEPGLSKLVGGRVIHINPFKVPRVIGKQGSMVSLIKKKTNCSITVGQNGVVWLKGTSFDDELRAVQAIKKIEAESHFEGLTDRITAFLDKGEQ